MSVTHTRLFFFALCLAALACFTRASAAQARQNTPLLKNPGFEGTFTPLPTAPPTQKAAIRGSLPSNWQDNSSWADVTVEYAADSSAHGGASALRVRGEAVRSGAIQLVQPVRFTKNNQYRFRVWLKGTNGTFVRLALRQAGSPYRTYAEHSYLMSGSWKECDVVGLVDEDTDGFVMLSTGGPGEFTADDAALDNLTRTISDAPPRVGNLLPNASFESGPNGGLQEPYRGGGWSIRSQGAGRPPLGSRTESLDVRAYRDTQSPAAVGASSLRLTVLPGRNVRVASPPVQFNFGRPHTLSLYLRSDTPGTAVYVALEKDGQARGLSKTFQVGPTWERYSITGTPGFVNLPFVDIRAENPQEDARPVTIWVDGVELEESAKTRADYIPAYPYELRLTCDQPGNVFFATEKIILQAHIGDGGTRTEPVPASTLRPQPRSPKGFLRVSLLDTTQTVRKTFTQQVSLATSMPNRNDPVTLSIPDAISRRPLGIFKARTELFASDGKTLLAAPAECVYARLPRPRQIDPTRSYFGVHVPLARDFARIAVATGNRWTRLHDTSMTAKWATMEQDPAQFEFFDASIDAVTKNGMAVVGMLDGAPAWTTTKPREGYWGFWNIPDKNGALEAWRRYVSASVAHYKGKIDTWEVWNEPWGEWWLGSGNPNATPARYGELLRAAYQEAHDANPDVTLLGVDTYFGTQNESWTKPVLAAAGPPYFDALSFHRYDAALFGGPQPTPTVETDFYRKAQEAVGGPVRPLWNTEGGPGAVGSFYLPAAGGIPPVLQPAQIVRFDVTQRASGVEKFILYAMHSDPVLGEIETHLLEYDRAITPLIAARAVLASLTDGVTLPIRSELTPGVEAYAYPSQAAGTLPDGATTVMVVWAFDNKPHEVRLPSKTTVLDIWGNPRPERGTITVGYEPVYFIK